jgi:hypothetical protein
VENAFLVPCEGRDELHVPLGEAQAQGILEHDAVRIGSILVTKDGRWWQSENLQSGIETVIIHRPGGLLRIDFTSDRAKLTVPWFETDGYWPGAVSLPDRLELFGREWHCCAWEKDAERTWLHFEFSHVLAAPDTRAPLGRSLRGLRTASAEMAWSQVQEALMVSIHENSSLAADRLRRPDLIPLARAICRLAVSLRRRLPLADQEIQRSLTSIRYFHAAVAPAYGRIPWRIVPPVVRDALAGRRLDPLSREIVNEVFDELPGAGAGRSTSPPQAA